VPDGEKSDSDVQVLPQQVRNNSVALIHPDYHDHTVHLFDRQIALGEGSDLITRYHQSWGYRYSSGNRNAPEGDVVFRDNPPIDQSED
jgi:hypothetical protein